MYTSFSRFTSHLLALVHQSQLKKRRKKKKREVRRRGNKIVKLHVQINLFMLSLSLFRSPRILTPKTKRSIKKYSSPLRIIGVPSQTRTLPFFLFFTVYFEAALLCYFVARTDDVGYLLSLPFHPISFFLSFFYRTPQYRRREAPHRPIHTSA